MKAIETDIIVSQDGQARIDLKLSADVPSDFPVHDFGPWPENLSLRRADLYGDDER
jgi:hypothetical protein